MQMRDFVWGLFLTITNPGEERASFTSMHVHFFERERCIMHAEELKALPMEKGTTGSALTSALTTSVCCTRVLTVHNPVSNSLDTQNLSNAIAFPARPVISEVGIAVQRHKGETT